MEGKPTLTLPHLEVGDYIETERIENQPGEGRRRALHRPTLVLPRREHRLRAQRVRDPVAEEPAAVDRDAQRRARARGRGARRGDRAPVAGRREPRGAGGAFRRADRRVSAERADRAGASRSSAPCRRCPTRAFDPTPRDPRITRIAERIVGGVPAETSERSARAASTAGWRRTSKKATKATAAGSSSARTATSGAATSRSAGRSTSPWTTGWRRAG